MAEKLGFLEWIVIWGMFGGVTDGKLGSMMFGEEGR